MAKLVKLHNARGDEILVNLDLARFVEPVEPQNPPRDVDPKTAISFDGHQAVYVRETIKEIADKKK